MATRNTNIIIPLEASVIDAKFLTGGWDELTPGYDKAVYLFRLSNTSDKEVEISFDGGLSARDYLPTDKIIELGAHPSENICWPINTPIHVKSAGGAAASGYIYLAAYTIKKDV